MPMDQISVERYRLWVALYITFEAALATMPMTNEFLKSNITEKGGRSVGKISGIRFGNTRDSFI